MRRSVSPARSAAYAGIIGLVCWLGGTAACSILMSTSGLDDNSSGVAADSGTDTGGDSASGDSAGSSASSGSSSGPASDSGSSSSGSASGSSGGSSSGSAAGSSSASSSGSSSASSSGGVAVCSPTATQCAGNDLETCGSDGQWGPGQPCAVACCGGACVDTATDPKNCGGCGVACGAGYACGTTFSAFTGSQPAGWKANGSAVYDASGNTAQLTDNVTGEAGTWIYAHELQIDTITVKFDFYNGISTGADGMGIMFEQNGPTAVGGGAGGLGIAGLTGFGVEIDDYNNGSCLDHNQNHIGIDSLTVCNSQMPTGLAVNDNPGFETDDGNWHTMIVSVANGSFTVTADGFAEFTSYTPSGWNSGSYYLGFGGGSGGLTNYHNVRNVTVTFATPHCY